MQWSPGVCGYCRGPPEILQGSFNVPIVTHPSGVACWFRASVGFTALSDHFDQDLFSRCLSHDICASILSYEESSSIIFTQISTSYYALCCFLEMNLQSSKRGL